MLNNTELKLIKNGKVRLVAVSKTRDYKEIIKIHNTGINNFGENYLQEALVKINKLKDKQIIWHFIGTIQANKTNDIADNFHYVHSVDRLKIANRLNNRCLETNKKLKILLQINADSEITKSGIKTTEITQLVMQIRHLSQLELIGFMCIPDKNNASDVFNLMHKLKNKFSMPELSMGMSADWRLAISHGTTMVRIGSAIFGSR